jgi:hypothetical protein
MKLAKLFFSVPFLLLSLSAVPGQVSAVDGREGGGGGGICIRARCRTLAEAGIRVRGNSDTSSRWYVTPAILREIEIISATLPFGKAEVEQLALGTASTVFSLTESVSRGLMREVTDDYRRVLRESGNGAMARNLKIFAISTDSTTYILPDFFRLDNRQKALILIHEGIVRTSNQDYRLALQFDGEYLDYVNRAQINDYSPLAFLRSLTAVIKDTHSQQQIPFVFDYIERKLGRRLSAQDFTDGEYTQNGALATIAQRALLRNQAFMNSYVSVFSAAVVSNAVNASARVTSLFTRDELLDACAESGDQPSARLKHPSEIFFVDCSSLGRSVPNAVTFNLSYVNAPAVRGL